MEHKGLPFIPELDRKAGERNTNSCPRGRARAGSRLQIQDMVNDRPAVLWEACAAALGLDNVKLTATWVSPLQHDGYAEYRDAAFLAALGLSRHARALAEFWPRGGPCWDALGRISGGASPAYILLEAKSRVSEMHGPGCRAAGPARTKVAAALEHARGRAAVGEADWLGPYYQAANRCAHLYFLRERCQVEAYLANVYFMGDPHSPTSASDFQNAIAQQNAGLGLGAVPAHSASVFLNCAGMSRSAAAAASISRRDPL